MSLRQQTVGGFVATAQPDRARAFYSDVLGLRLVTEHDFALVYESGGSVVRVQKVRELRAQEHTVLGWIVDDIEAEVDELARRGVTFLRVPGLRQDARGIWTPPGGQKVCWFKDPDGNTLSLNTNEAAAS
jgi:catechol 2,3-dioxygenase-like lactoylglutathione lyase family enzyme